jgi:hypothetical protein
MSKRKTMTFKCVLPAGTRWIATDADGTVRSFLVDPIPHPNGYESWSLINWHAGTIVARVAPPEDWRKTLRKV